MKTTLIRHLRNGLLLTILAILSAACHSNRKEAAKTATAFLQAYYVDLDFDKAKSLCNDASRDAIDDQAMMVGLNPYAKDEIPDIVVCKIEIDPDNPTIATCTYTCNRTERILPLRQLNNTWIVDLGGATVETANFGGEFITLSQEGANGFASATSGEIKYRKRRQGNN